MVPFAEKLSRILIEQDLYKNGEGDTLRSPRRDDLFYRITYTDGWWDLEKIKDGKCFEKTSFDKASRLVRKLLNEEKIEY